MSHLQDEIHEQPGVLARFIAEESENVARVATEVRNRGIQYIIIAARGTSDNAATYGKYLFAIVNSLPVALAAPSLYTIYERPPRMERALVMGISQSGESPDIVAVLAEARRQGVPSLALTNIAGSPITQVADYTILCRAGEEHSIAATKTYTAQLTALALFASMLAGDRERVKELESLPAAVEKTLTLEETIASHAQRYRYMNACVVIGRGYNYATAYEIALKIKELTYVMAEPYSPADFMHGPIAIVEHGFPVFIVAPRGRLYDDVLQFARQLHQQGAELINISDGEECLDLATTPFALPVSVPEWLSPITCIVPGQLFALHLTSAKGFDPDHPRGLRKVTKTR
ncbi:MAG: SIS domain-containing protein [Chloroflexi bacterium]|nr:SIS domain-containing protein [Chloroflexota bacterium]